MRKMGGVKNINVLITITSMLYLRGIFVFIEIWLEWIQDEMPLACITEHKAYIRDLFEKAVNDYQCGCKSILNLIVSIPAHITV